MATIRIPGEWCHAVCAALETEDTTNRTIRWTGDARKRYESDFFNVWPYELYEPLRAYLGAGDPEGCPIRMDRPPGETYEFFFGFKGRKAFGKILLCRDRRSIVIFSAHLPAREKLSCE